MVAAAHARFRLDTVLAHRPFSCNPALSEHLYNTAAYTLSSILPKTFAKANEMEEAGSRSEREWRELGFL